MIDSGVVALLAGIISVVFWFLRVNNKVSYSNTSCSKQEKTMSAQDDSKNQPHLAKGIVEGRLVGCFRSHAYTSIKSLNLQERSIAPTPTPTPTPKLSAWVPPSCFCHLLAHHKLTRTLDSTYTHTEYTTHPHTHSRGSANANMVWCH